MLSSVQTLEKPSRRPFTLHGYHPEVIDERRLTQEDCRLVQLGQTRFFDPEFRKSWRQYLTRAELQAIDEVFSDDSPELKSLFSLSGLGLSAREAKFLRREIGMKIAFARLKYAGGQRVVYGDAPHRSP